MFWDIFAMLYIVSTIFSCGYITKNLHTNVLNQSFVHTLAKFKNSTGFTDAKDIH